VKREENLVIFFNALGEGWNLLPPNGDLSRLKADFTFAGVAIAQRSELSQISQKRILEEMS